MLNTDDPIDALVLPLFEKMSARVTPDEIETMTQAYLFAREAHSNQRRKSGEPYIIHPIAVARIVGEELELGANPVSAAFLHDVVEDTPTTIDEIRDRFGDDIAFLVKVVTKNKKAKFQSSGQVENFRQMLDSVNYDIRAILIKLADRLHNMRTLSSMLPEKQMKIAGETDYFYAPLANRLGLYNVKTELENLSLRYRCPQLYTQLKEMITTERESIRPMLEGFRTRISDLLRQGGIKADVHFVSRQPYSIRRKMQQNNTDFLHLERMHTINIIFDNPEGASEKATALRIYSLLTDVFEEKPHSVSNYIDHPKENGYQSLHVHLLADNGHWQEVHISSCRMHRVQQLGCIADINDVNIAGWLTKLKTTLRDMAANSHEVNFMEGVAASFYNDDIIVYTPEGRQITLPSDATALDFAFEVHTDIGLHARYARINSKLRPLLTKLQRGDVIEIGFDETTSPKPEYLDHVVTYKAKRHMASWLASRPEPRFIRCPHCQPLPDDEVIGFRPVGAPDFTPTDVHKRDCHLAISRASQQGESVVAVDFTPDDTRYRVKLTAKGVDRNHLLADLVNALDSLNVPIADLRTITSDAIAECHVEICVHSATELREAIARLRTIPGIDEVTESH